MRRREKVDDGLAAAERERHEHGRAILDADAVQRVIVFKRATGEDEALLFRRGSIKALEEELDVLSPAVPERSERMLRRPG